MIQESETTGLDSDAAPRRMAMTDCSSEDQSFIEKVFKLPLVKMGSVVVEQSW